MPSWSAFGKKRKTTMNDTNEFLVTYANGVQEKCTSTAANADALANEKFGQTLDQIREFGADAVLLAGDGETTKEDLGGGQENGDGAEGDGAEGDGADESTENSDAGINESTESTESTEGSTGEEQPAA